MVNLSKNNNDFNNSLIFLLKRQSKIFEPKNIALRSILLKMSSSNSNKSGSNNSNEKPGDGIRSMRSTTAFRVVNFELYAKPNIVIMSIGLTCFGLALGYIAYMRQKYEAMGYYSAIDKDGKEIFEKKKSKWD